MEMDGGHREWVPSLYPELSLTAVRGGANEVDGDVVVGNEAGKVEELV